jgi:hypothetical protein
VAELAKSTKDVRASSSRFSLPRPRPRASIKFRRKMSSDDDIKSRHQRAGFLWKLPMSKCVLRSLAVYSFCV